MHKRIVSALLAAALFISSAPMTYLAETTNKIVYGDVDADGNIGLKDALTLRLYIAEQNPSNFNLKNADVNADNKVDTRDLLLLKKYLAEWEGVELGVTCTVSFYDGDKLIDTMKVQKGNSLSEVPSVEKSSKENAILLGYYTDKEFTKPFYAENPVTEDMTIYAKYQEMGNAEELNITSFAQMDQSPNLSFEIQKVSGSILPEEAVTLIVKDGSDPVELSITDAGNGGYTVKAKDGFKEGASYELALADGWIFKDKPETIRTAAFSIDMEEVANIQMSDDITYIKDTDSMNYTVDGSSYEVLTSEQITENGGTFSYNQADSLKEADILCIYTGIHPQERDNKDGSELLDPVVYVKVGQINGNTVTFVPLGENDQQKLYNIPDNFPILVPALPTADTGTVNISELDATMYATMMGEEGTKEQALNEIEVGDFVTLYVSQESLTSEDALYYGQITAYNAQTGEITYKRTTMQAIMDSMDLYNKIDITGNDLVTEEEKQELEEVLLSQIEESDFAEEAAYLLADLVTKTDGFRENMSVHEFLLSDEDGNPLSEEEIALLNLGGSFELSDDIKLSVELITEGDQLHWYDGVQLAIGVDAKFEVEVEDGDKIAFDLSATFVQEAAVDPTVKGEIVLKKILFIPVPVGVQVSSTIDVKSYTALSFAAEIYTIAAEDKNIWEKVKDITNDPTEVLGLAGIPDGLKDGLKTVGDVMDKLEELKGKIDKATETKEQLDGYAEDIEALWAVVEETGVTTKEDWEQMGKTLGKTSVTSDLLELMNMSEETGLSTEYLESMQALMDKYSEMLQKETDWVKLVDQQIFAVEVNVCGIAIGVQADFVVRTDMSIAIGSNLEYEVGKRYNFWFKVGLFKPTAGSSSMDLIDERFAFQFYVMGKLGVKAGIQVKAYVGIGTGKFASVGLTAELGPYIKLYGFFVYEYEKYRPANTQDWTSKERMAGALYMETGIYFVLGVEANAIGDLFEWSHDFIDEEIPILTAGNPKYYYACAYEPLEDESVLIRDEDENSTTGITMTLPQFLQALSYVELDTGIQGEESLDYGNYHYTLSNPNFTFDKETGTIGVNVPENTRYMECDLTITYLYGKVAFSHYDMSVTVPLVWTNLSTAELNEYYTASVRVGNDKDGYQTVWSKRVRKNQEYDLPTEEEIKEMIGWNDAKYSEGTGYGNQKTTGLTLIEDKVYDYNVDYKTYHLTVTGIQNTDGSTSSKTYDVQYGKTFDFSDLVDTGTYKVGETYTKFVNATTEATIEVNGQAQVIDLTQPVNAKVAEALKNGAKAVANYEDNSVTVRFSFVGFEIDDVTMKLGKGETPSLAEIERIAAEEGRDIVDISPIVGKVNAVTDYQVTLGELTGPDVTISFEENGGSAVEDITKKFKAQIGTLPVPERIGYTFGGWYTDNNAFENEFTDTKMPKENVTLYAKWTANTYTVSFHVNGGNELSAEELNKNVIYDTAYGTLPEPTRTGYGFAGWYTEAEGGTQVNNTDMVAITENKTLYAHWNVLKDIPNTIFDFGEIENPTYEKNVGQEVVYTFNSEEGATYKAEDFTFKYMRQGDSEYVEGLPINAGTYNVTVSRTADNQYNKFEYTYNAVITINKATRTLETVALEFVDNGYTFLEVKLAENAIDDLSEKAIISYEAIQYNDGLLVGTAISGAKGENTVYGLNPNTTYAITVTVTDDPNYEDAVSTKGVCFDTVQAPTDSWLVNDNYDISWYNDTDDSFTINTAEQLAGLSYLVASGTDSFMDKEIILGADIDLTGHEWSPIGYSKDYPFEGWFYGKHHKITGIHCASNNSYYIGLFGYVDRGEIDSVLVDDAYFSGKAYVGGIAGSARASTINNCVSYAMVYASGKGDNANAGGIVGEMYCDNKNQAGEINHCVNYGKVVGNANHDGGIAGYIEDEVAVINCANYGDVSGVSCVGGIVGEVYSKTSEVYNCFTVGTIKGTNKYIGAVVGRNNGNDGTILYGYYLKGSASCNGASRNALGTEKGSLDDGTKGTKTAFFTATDSTLSKAYDYGNQNLITVLNAWVEEKDASHWFKWEATGPNGYPLPQGSLTRE